MKKKLMRLRNAGHPICFLCCENASMGLQKIFHLSYFINNIYLYISYFFIFIYFIVVEILEELERFSDSDEDVHFHDDQATVFENKKNVTVYISPPENDEVTDEDSEDEEDVQLTNLPGKQIISHATTERFINLFSIHF